MIRIGHGYDVHRFAPDRDLVLGGVKIPYEYGLDGHSAADVLTHAVCDALLGSLALGDIGKHFPDTDPAYRGVDSLLLLAACRDKLRQAGYAVVNVDATVIAQKPKLSPYIEAMRVRLSETLRTDPSFVSVKATTEEGLGFTGALQGIAAHAVVLVQNTEQ